jgi:DeoR/GlpR family transcriptional regulator of sugar metabolism
MLIVERQDRLVELLRDRGAGELDELAEAVGVSASTVRRDLEALEQRGLVRRTHGGAVLVNQGTDADPLPAKPQAAAGSSAPGEALAARMTERVEAKRAIGAVAAAMVQPQMTVLLDGGSTVVYAATQIVARPIQVVTNSLTIAQHFKDDDQVELLLLGGELYPRTEVTLGPIAAGTLAELHADLLLVSLAGIWGDAAFNINLDMARLERLMMQQAARSVLLMDQSKFGRKSLVRVCGLDEVDAVVTDTPPPAEYAATLGERLTVVSDATA